MPEFEKNSEINTPLPIGHGQTISQPETVIFMLELLQVKKGSKVLEIGSGSGWVTALLCHIVEENGFVFAIERIPEILEFGAKNLSKYPLKNFKLLLGDGSRGLKEEAPFDRILVSAAAQKVPIPLKEQLVIGGRLVIPTAKNDIRLITRINQNEYNEEIFEGFLFVPLVEG